MARLRRNRGEAGFSLVEMVVATSILGIVLLLVYGTLNGGVRQAADAESRFREEADVRTAVDSFVRDVRQAYTGDPSTQRIATMTATQLTFYSPDRATPFHLRKISYRVSGTRLERSSTVSTDTDGFPWTFGTAGPYVLAIDGVRNTTVFTYRDQDGNVTTVPSEVATVGIALTIDADAAHPHGPLSYQTTVDLRGVI